MATSGEDQGKTDDIKAATSGVDPTDTDHPTGDGQAAENAADESPS